MLIKISKVIADLNVGRQKIEEFLRTKGITIDASINARIDEDIYVLLLKEFRPDLDPKSMLDKIARRRSVYTTRQHTTTRDVHEIKTVVPGQKPKILGKIDLDAAGKPKSVASASSKEEVKKDKPNIAAETYSSYFEEDDSIVSYPLISEYVEAIKLSEDNLDKLSSLRPVLDADGRPVMSSGNFAVVFKMEDKTDGKLYALKCFTKYQEGRNKAYQQIANELKGVSSSYLVSIKYLSKELFVNSKNSTDTEFPVVLMDWVSGQTLDNYIKAVRNDKEEMIKLTSQFFKLASWLLKQPFAHGDLKPDNILVREDGSLVLVDYDGMFVPAMEGERARELGSPNFRLPTRDASVFNRNIDDFPITTISLALRALTLRPELLEEFNANDALLFVEDDFHNIAGCKLYHKLCTMLSDNGINQLILALHLSFTGVPIGDAYFKILRSTAHDDSNKTTAVDSQVDERVKNLLTAAENGDYDAFYELALCYEEGEGIEKNMTEAAKWFELAAEEGDAKAQNKIGEFYYYGLGVKKKDTKTAVKWFQMSAEQGHSGSQCWLGYCYKRGIGVDKDIDKAKMWYQKAMYPSRVAANEGNVDAQIDLGYCYRFGDGVKRDVNIALQWFHKAAEQNASEAQNALGDCFSRDRQIGIDYETAVAWYQKAAEQGYPEAQFSLGECYEKGNGVPQDYNKAIYWYSEAAKQGLPESYYHLGKCHQNGFGVDKDELVAFKWFAIAAERGEVHAQAYLGECYENGTGCIQDYAEALKWYSLAIESGDSSLYSRMERIYDKYIDPGRDINWFISAAEKGDVIAQFHLGRCYYYGVSVKRDYEEALKWFHMASEQGNSRSMIFLGECSEEGLGVTQDYDEAFYWYNRAYEQGDLYSYIRLGKCYYYGHGVEKDYGKAYKWFRKAVKQSPSAGGGLEGKYYLGECFFYGLGIIQDFKTAVKWFQKAAKYEYVEAQYRLGECYEKGIGIDQDESEAMSWYQKAANQGYVEAIERLAELGEDNKEDENPFTWAPDPDSEIIGSNPHDLDAFNDESYHNDQRYEINDNVSDDTLSTKVTDDDINNGVIDEFGVVYSPDRKRLLKATKSLQSYIIKPGTKVIADYAFWCQFSISNIVFPDSITHIGDKAFYHCEKLKDITIPYSVSYIGSHSFEKCESLTSISIPNSVTQIEDWTFSGCKKLMSITIPDSVISIGNAAFGFCDHLTNISIPNSVTSIGEGAFSTCYSLASIYIPNSVRHIGEGAFYECQSLKDVKMPNSITSIENQLFYHCTELFEINIPNTVTNIGDYAFWGCDILTKVNIPDSVTNIGSGCFFGCYSLRSIFIPNSVKQIGGDALSFSGLKSYVNSKVYIPKGCYQKFSRMMPLLWDKLVEVDSPFPSNNDDLPF